MKQIVKVTGQMCPVRYQGEPETGRPATQGSRVTFASTRLMLKIGM